MASSARRRRSKFNQGKRRGKAGPVGWWAGLGGWGKRNGWAVTILLALGVGAWRVVVHVDDRMQGHASIITSTLTSQTSALTSQISEVKSDVRHLDTNTRTSDSELREDIQQVRDELRNVQSDVKRVSTDVESLAEDVDLLTKDVRSISGQRVWGAPKTNEQAVSVLDLE